MRAPAAPSRIDSFDESTPAGALAAPLGLTAQAIVDTAWAV
ncbi:hypothetical protein J2X20_002095 [Pelomonas saccharophila]|uniref:Uncharacterized protein n=1 Tax=Roseateles saccharophilus TaxID=304 RepID=A0ABU1YML8_ROSSA|nr:hypothetical protein [Roseateles saccharophilus]MDR7269466.1 hypothetical protein [Roseateles saccharophilus]